MSKTLTNIQEAKEAISDLEVFGNGDAWELICKASSQSEGWMKATKAMPVKGLGCLVHNPNSSYAIAEALTCVPGASILHYCS